jgi:hypothetical protein
MPLVAPVRESSRPPSSKRPKPTCSVSRLCGGVTALVRAGFETLTEAGYAPEMPFINAGKQKVAEASGGDS